MDKLKQFLELNSLVVTIFGTSVFGVTSALVTRVLTRVRKTNERLKTHDSALIAILHDKLYTRCNEYLVRGYVTVAEMNNLKYLYNSYHELGGNGTGTALYERVLALPIK